MKLSSCNIWPTQSLALIIHDRNCQIQADGNPADQAESGCPYHAHNWRFNYKETADESVIGDSPAVSQVP